MKTFEFVLIAITTVAALATVYFARETVKDARMAARSQRVERLSRRLAELAAVTTELRGYVFNANDLQIPQTQTRLRVLLAGVDLDLPLTRALAAQSLATSDDRLAHQNDPDSVIVELGDATGGLGD
jgi:hypothetical protein